MRKEKLTRLSLVVPARRANLRRRIIARFLVGLIVLASCAQGRVTHAQSCNPAIVSYIVRDENGEVLGAAALKSIAGQLPGTIGEAQPFAGESSVAEDGQTVYWAEDVEWAKGKKVPSLQFINAATCRLHLAEVTLVYRNKKMRLIFNLEITGAQPARRPVIDSLPFQEGTFALDLNGWPRSMDQVIPSARWKKVETSTSLTPRRPNGKTIYQAPSH